MAKRILEKLVKLAIGTLIVVTVLSCARFQKLERNLRQIKDATLTFQGDVVSSLYPDKPVVIAFMNEEEGASVLGYRVLEQSGYFHMTTGVSARKLLAFNDLNGDLKLQENEPYAIYLRPKTGNEKHFNKVELILKTTQSQSADLPDEFNNHDGLKYFKIKDQEVHTGTIKSLIYSGFDLNYAPIGAWQPYRFITEGHTGVFFRTEYDPSKIPVLLIHGLGGSPLNFKAIIGEMDKNKYQPWMYSYAAGLSLDTNAAILKNILVAMHHKYGFQKIH